MGASVEPYELWGAVVVRGLWPPFTAYKLPDGAENRAEGLAKLVVGVRGRRALYHNAPARPEGGNVRWKRRLGLARAEGARNIKVDAAVDAARHVHECKVASDDRAVAGKYHWTSCLVMKSARFS